MGDENLTYVHLWDAYVAGARDARLNPTATEKDFNRGADAYCKLIHSQVDPKMFAKLLFGGGNSDGP